MGRIGDFFKRILNRKDNNNNNIKARSSVPNYEDTQDLNLYYGSGASAHVKFDDELTRVMLNDGTYKELQRARVMYINPDNSLFSKDVLLEPINTKEYYKDLTKTNLPLIKGFFEQNQVRSLDTDYIGYIGKNEDGTYNRSYDNKFKQIYKEMYKQKSKEDNARYNDAQEQKDKAFREELMNKTEKYGVHYKKDHAQYLGNITKSKDDDKSFPEYI